jgi:hypothetical protein
MNYDVEFILIISSFYLLFCYGLGKLLGLNDE